MAMPTNLSLEVTSAVREAAARWYARMTSDVKTATDQAAFDVWVAAAPENADAYAEVCALAGRLDALVDHPEVSEMRADVQRFEEKQRRPVVARLSNAWTATGVAAAVAVAAFFYFSEAPLESEAWSTARGQTREIALSDGSHVVLGSDSRLEMRFGKRRRELVLEYGQSFFDVAHQPTRPFTVSAGERTVTALGTVFDVRAYQNETSVTVVRGSVAIARDTEDRKTVLEAGQQFRVAFGIASVQDVDPAIETSWRTGVLDFDAVTLMEAVTEFNRSAAHSIVVTDPRLTNLRVSGVFRANDPQGFTAALVPAYPVLATLQSSGDIVLSYREASAIDATR